jgi:hypothetical protein
MELNPTFLDTPNSSKTSTGVAGTANRSGWLLELERAAWKDQPHPETRDGTSTPVHDDGEFQPKDLHGMTSGSSIDNDSMANQVILMGAQNVAMSSVVIPQAQIPGSDSSPANVTLLNLQPSISNRPAMPTLAGRISNSPDKVLTKSTFEPNDQLATRNLHAVAAEDQVKVWIREPQLTASAGLKLLSAVRAELKSLGYHLDELVINGRPIVHPDAQSRMSSKR